jgi:hypothetical protein
MTTVTAQAGVVSESGTKGPRGTLGQTDHQMSQSPTPTKENGMKRGHVTGHKRERKGSTDWYKSIEQANLERIEKEWQEKQKQGK